MKYISSMQQLAVVPVEEDAGVGQDSQTIRRYLENLMADYYKPLSRQWANPAIRFSNLEKEWKESTPILSSITDIVMHP